MRTIDNYVFFSELTFDFFSSTLLLLSSLSAYTSFAKLSISEIRKIEIHKSSLLARAVCPIYGAFIYFCNYSSEELTPATAVGCVKSRSHAWHKIVEK